MSYQRLVGRHRMRCSRGARGCGRRFTLPRNPDDYARTPRCPHCGSVFAVSVEVYRRREAETRPTCRCAAYPFPHRAGSLVACDHHADRADGVPMSQDDQRAWEATCRTARGSCTRPEPPDPLTCGLGIRATIRGGDVLPF